MDRIIHVVGGSMIPFVLPGSVLRVERVPFEEIEKGDVICVIGENSGGGAHRVVEKMNSEDRAVVLTRGDAREFGEIVPAESVVFVVRRVEHRLFSYDSKGSIGRIIAHVALGDSFLTSLLRDICRCSFAAIALSRRVVREIRPRR